MSIYVWFEASKSGYDFWKCLFDVIYPDIAIETNNSNSKPNMIFHKSIIQRRYLQSYLKISQKNTGFETDKSKVGSCFIKGCYE